MPVERRLVNIVRRRERLVPLCIERTTDVSWASARLQAAAALSESLPLAVVQPGIDDLSLDRRTDPFGAVEAWPRLRSTQVTPESLADLLRVLAGTTLDEPESSGISSFRGAEPARPFRPTAAHPRAYEGTGARPPKPPAPRRVDLQGAAVDPRAVRTLLQEFTGMLPAALDLLPDEVRSHARLFLAAATEDRALGGWDGTAFLRDFRLLVWPQVRRLPEAEVSRLYGAFRRHPRHDERSLSVAAAWCLSSGPPEVALRWLHSALSLQDRLAEIALVVWADVGAHHTGPDAIPLTEIAAEDVDEAHFALDLWALLEARTRGVEAHLMVPGLDLSRGLDLRHHVGPATPQALVPSAPLVEFAIVHGGEAWHRLAPDLWRALSSVPGFAPLFLAQPWDDLHPKAAERLVRAVLFAGASDERPGLVSWWMDHLGSTVEAVRTVPTEFQEKFADTVGECVDMWGRRDKLRALWPDVLRIAARLAHPPYRPEARAFEVWNNLIEVRDDSRRTEVIEAPDRVWLRLEKRSRVPAAAYLLGLGFDVLGYHAPDLLVRAFLDGTPLLYEVARLLGALSTESADVICRSLPEGDDEPVGRLADLRHRILDELGSGVGGDVGRREVQHALALQRSIGDNRRALRRFLRAHMDGDSEYIQRHPLTRRWLAAHPNLRLDRWLDGITLEAEVEGMGRLTIRLEDDPLEVLQLGTYVGSCLSVGGLCDYSAAAAALDINKTVVYARTRRGGVTARQLLAMSEEGQLVAFAVYPHSAPRVVKRLFADYDRRFARALDVRLCTAHKGATYTVSEVISQKWWDDGAWKSRLAPASSSR